MDTIKMTEEIPKIKDWLNQNNVDSICFDVIYDDIVKVSLSKRANDRLWTTQHMFELFDIDLGVVSDYLEELAKVLNEKINKETSK